MADDHDGDVPAMSNRGITLERYQHIMDTAGYVLFTADLRGYFTQASGAVMKLTGYAPGELIGAHFSKLVKPDWHDLVTDFYVQQREQRQKNSTFLFPIITRDGEERWIEQQVIATEDTESGIVFQAIAHDVTERQRTEQALRTSETRLKAFFENAAEALVIIDSESRIVQVNRSAETIFEYTREEMIGEPLDMLIPERYQAAHEQHVEGFLEMPGTRLMGRGRELCALRKEGSEFPAEISLSYNETTGETVAFIIDISERVRTQTALVESEERLRSTLESVDDLVFVLDKTGVFVDYYQPPTVPGLPQQPEQFVGRSYQEMLPDHVAGFVERSIDAVMQTEKTQQFDYMLTVGDDKQWFNAKVSMRKNELGQFDGVTVVARNITRRIQFQHELASRIGQLTTLREMGAALAEHLDIQPVQEIALQSAAQLSQADAGFIGLFDQNRHLKLAEAIGAYDNQLPGKNLGEGRGIISRVVNNCEAELIVEARADPDYVPYREQTASLMVIPLVSREELIGVLTLETSRPDVFNEDSFALVKLIAERIATAMDNARLHQQTSAQLQELQTLYAKVSQLEQLKTDMIRIAAHDLRNPLSAILGNVELIRMGIEAGTILEDLPEFATNIEEGVQRMRKITSDILSMERIEQAAQNMVTARLDLAELARTVFEENSAPVSVASRQVALSTADGPVMVQGDSAQLREAMANLISNAIKYTPDGGRIHVRLRQTGTEVVFEVEDTGIGILKAQQEKLFQPFYRARTSETLDIEGTGLGLHLVKNIIDRHQGAIHFKSVYGQGSTFGFSLPIVQE